MFAGPYSSIKNKTTVGDAVVVVKDRRKLEAGLSLAMGGDGKRRMGEGFTG